MSDLNIKEYFAVEGSNFSHTDAKRIGPVLAELAAAGDMTADAVVEAAKSSNSPLREYFEWEDKTAAHLYRVEQARLMIRSIKVRVIDDGKEYEARAFQIHRTASDRGGTLGAYKPVAVQLSDGERFAETAENAVTELLSWQRRYAQYAQVWPQFAEAFKPVLAQMRSLPPPSGAKESGAALVTLFDWRLKHEIVGEKLAEHAGQLAKLFAAVDTVKKLVAIHRNRIVDQVATLLAEPVKRRCERCNSVFETRAVAQTACEKCQPKRSVA